MENKERDANEEEEEEEKEVLEVFLVEKRSRRKWDRWWQTLLIFSAFLLLVNFFKYF